MYTQPEPSEYTEGVTQSLFGKERMRWAPSPFGVAVSVTSELRVYPGLTRNLPSSPILGLAGRKIRVKVALCA